MDRPLRIEDVLDYAIESFTERLTYEIEVSKYSFNDDDGEFIDEIIHEVSDEEIPIYHTELLAVCMSDISLATETPEMECDNAISCIQANIYQEIYDVLNGRKEDIYDEIKKNNK